MVGKVNIDENPDLAAHYGIASIPTLILFKNGKPCPPVVGPGGKGGILQYLNEICKRHGTALRRTAAGPVYGPGRPCIKGGTPYGGKTV